MDFFPKSLITSLGNSPLAVNLAVLIMIERTAHNGNVVFEPIAKIEPQDVSILKVVVRAKKEGDVRFTVEINGNELTRPVKEAESTNFYE